MLTLLLGLRVAACPESYYLADSASIPGWEDDFASFCTNGKNALLGPVSKETPTKEFLCSPATKQTPCCLSQYVGETSRGRIFCVSDSAEPAWKPGGTLLWDSWAITGAPQYVCNETVNSANWIPAIHVDVSYSRTSGQTDNYYYLASVDCTSELQDSSDTPQGLSAAATAGIVVGAVLGPFLLGGIYSYFS